MATNNFNNVSDIAKMAADAIENELGLAKAVSRKYDDSFKDSMAKKGDTYNVRIPAAGYAISEGGAVSANGYTDSYVPVTLQQYTVGMAFTTKELRLNVESGDAFKQNVVTPQISSLANKIDQILWDAAAGISNKVGVPGTSLTNQDLLLDAAAILDELGVPRERRTAVLSPRHTNGIIKGTSTYFNPNADIADQYRNGTLPGLCSGFKIFADSNIVTHTVGTFGTSTPLMNGATVSGATQIVTDGWASGASALNVGDKLAIANVYAVNPVSKNSTGQLLQLTVTEACDDTSGAMTIKISPAIVTSGINQNATAVPANDAAIYVWGTANNASSAKTGATSLVFHPDALTLCTVDLPSVGEDCVRILHPRLNMSFRMNKFYNGNTDQLLHRIDILAGAGLTRKDFAVKVLG